MEIGAQFYTIRDFCKNTDDFAESLKKVADIGYKNVQISGTCEFSPEWLKAELAKNGLKCVLTHTPADKLKSDPASMIFSGADMWVSAASALMKKRTSGITTTL